MVGGVWHALGRGVQVSTWLDHGVQFRAGEGFNRRRRDDIDIACWHWTGAENGPLQMAETLKKRKLGVEFAIDRDGRLYQFADPLVVDTADAGSINSRSVGIEIVSYGVRSWDRAWLLPKHGELRATHRELLQGSVRTVADFFPPQTATACALAHALSAALPIPRKVPLTVDGTIIPTALAPEKLRRYRGHLGHFHVSAQKLDPGRRLLEDIGRAIGAFPQEHIA
jgi:hypothetical protein